MTWKTYRVEQGEYAISWDTCCRIIASRHRAKWQLQLAQETSESQISLNPYTWGLPDLHFLTVDWDKVRENAEADALSDGWLLAAKATFDRSGIDALVRTLKDMQVATRTDHAKYRKRLEDCTRRSAADIEATVSKAECALQIARFFRDTSGSVLIGAATVVTGGTAAVAVAGGGTVLKSVGKYQDTGSVGSATIEAVQNIAFAVFPAARGAALAGREKAVKVVATVAADTSKAMIEGRPVGTALAEGAIAVPVAVMGDGVKKGLSAVLGKVAVPIVAKVAEDKAKKAAQGVVRGALAGEQRRAQQEAGAARAAGASSIAERVSLDDDMLLKFAVIDMRKGIGGSWW
jgi:hypothetical protein